MKDAESFKEDIFNLVGNEYSVLKDYEGYKVPILFQHNTCQRIFEQTPHNFKRGIRCQICTKENRIKNRTKNTDQFKKEVFDLVGNEYTVLGEYIGTNDKILMRHNKCNYEYMVTPNKFASALRRCPVCAKKIIGEKLVKSLDQFKKEVFDLVGNEYTVLGEYINTNTKILMKHNSNYCGNREFLITPNTFLNLGRRCKVCSGKMVNKASFEIDFYKKFNSNEFIIMNEYISLNTPIELKHSICNETFHIMPYYVRNINTEIFICPKCEKNSVGEKIIRKYLQENSIFFNEEVYFEGCKYKLPLKFDFQVFYEDNTFVLIEFDGIQHHNIVEFYGGEEDFKERKKRDSIKNKFCQDNNIPLLRISYKDIKIIETILDDFLFNSPV